MLPVNGPPDIAHFLCQQLAMDEWAGEVAGPLQPAPHTDPQLKLSMLRQLSATYQPLSQQGVCDLSVQYFL